MTTEEKQIYKCKIHLVLKLARLQDEYSRTNGYTHIGLAKKIKKIKQKIKELEE